MNKKLVLSVLSTAVVASMTSAAMAKADPGFYIGGNVDKYYSVSAFLKNQKQALAEILKNVNSTTFVPVAGKATSFAAAVDTATPEELAKVLHDVTKADFEANPYTVVGENRTYDPTTDKDLPGTATGDLKVESVSAIDGSAIKVKFGAPVLESDVVTAGTNVLKNVTIAPVGSSAAITAANTTAELSEDGTELTIFANLGTEFFKGTYNIQVAANAIHSQADVTKAIAAFEDNLTVSDTTKPTISGSSYKADGSGKYDVTVKFSEALSTVGTVSVNGVVTPATLSTDGKSAVVAGLNAGTNYTISITGAKDAAGNVISPNPATTTVNLSADTVKPTVAVTVSNNVFTFDFSEEVKTLAPNSVVINGTDYTASLVPDAVDTTKFTLNAETAGILTGSFVNASVVVKGFKDLADNPGDTVTKSFTLNADKTAPSFVSASYNADTFIVKFNENVASSTLTAVDIKYTGSDNVPVTYTGAAVTATDGLDLNGDGDALDSGEAAYVQLKVTAPPALLSGGNLKPGKYEVSVAKDKIVDTATVANKAAAFKFTTTVTGTANPQPTLQVSTVSEVSPGVITVDFSADVDASALVASNYKLDGVALPATTATAFDGVRDVVTLTLPADYITVTGARTLEVVNVKDVDGNTLDTAADSSEITFTENVKPEAKSAALVSDKAITVTFSENLANPAAATGIEVYVNGAKIDTATNALTFAATNNVLSITAANADTFAANKTIQVKFVEGNTVADTQTNKAKVGQVTVQ